MTQITVKLTKDLTLGSIPDGLTLTKISDLKGGLVQIYLTHVNKQVILDFIESLEVTEYEVI